MVSNDVEHGYWNFRGFAGFTRLTLAAAGAEYTEKAYDFANKESWAEDAKPKLDTHLPNLPYLKVDGVVVSEHDAVMRVAANKWKPALLGATDAEKHLVETYWAALIKTNMAVRSTHWKDSTEEEHQKSVEAHDKLLSAIDKRLGEGKWIASADVSIVDIYFHEILLALKLTHKDSLAKYTNFQRWEDDFHAQEWYKNFTATDKWFERPLYPPHAKINT